ncbi:MAG: carbohydrate binding domain-containing protein [Alistipes sp.]|nr:carbohydrate binding domain-containing protein [Alistipes sp.]
MNLKKLAGRFISAATAGIMLAAGFSVMPVGSGRIEVEAASDVTVDISKEHQLIRGFGGINHPEWTGQDMTASQLQTAFGNGADELGLTVLRVFVNPDKTQWYRALPAAQYATEHGAYVFASPWEPPSNLAESGGSNGKLHLPKANYEAYANHLNDFGTYMKNNGVDLYSISVQNEPDYASEWTYWSTDEVVDFMANYGHLITSTRLMSPESFQYSPDGASWISGGDGGKRFYTKIMNNAKAMENCDLFGTHFYGTTRDWMDFPALENSGKEIWMTEVYVPNSEADSANRFPEALDVAENIHNGMVVGNMSAYTWWYIRRSYGLMDESGKITKRGYMMSQYSKWIRPGYIRVDATEKPESDVFVSAYKGGGDKVVIVAVNKGTTEYNKNFTVSGGSISDVDRYRTTGSANLEETADMAYNGSTFNAQIPAQSVSTFVVTLSDASGIPDTSGDLPGDVTEEPNEYGWWYQCGFENGDDNWVSRGSSTAEVSTDEHYTEWGSHSLKVTGREKTWNGASLALKSSIFKSGESYSFSAHVEQNSGENVKFMMKLEYTNSDGDTGYSEIATVTAPSGAWAQLSNKSYTIPDGATNLKIYIETEESLTDFYIDEAIGAVDGTSVAGEGQPELPTEPATAPTTKPVDFIPGDIDGDGRVSAYDMTAMRKGVIGSFGGDAAALAADVNADGTVDVADIVLLEQYLLGRNVDLKRAAA